MSFLQSKFAPVSAHSSNTPKVWSYSTNDALPVVSLNGYFNKKIYQLNVKDIILTDIGGVLYFLKVTSVTDNVVVTVGKLHQVDSSGNIINSRVSMFTILPGTYDTEIINAGEWYKVSGAFEGYEPINFSISEDGIAIYTGIKEVLSVTGVSDIQTDKASTIEFGLFLNGELIPGATTPHTFSAPSKTENISITGLIELVLNDEVDVYCKSSVPITLTVNTLRVTFWGN